MIPFYYQCCLDYFILVYFQLFTLPTIVYGQDSVTHCKQFKHMRLNSTHSFSNESQPNVPIHPVPQFHNAAQAFLCLLFSFVFYTEISYIFEKKFYRASISFQRCIRMFCVRVCVQKRQLISKIIPYF